MRKYIIESFKTNLGRNLSSFSAVFCTLFQALAAVDQNENICFEYYDRFVRMVVNRGIKNAVVNF